MRLEFQLPESAEALSPTAKVIWSRGEYIGLKFDQPLTAAELAEVHRPGRLTHYQNGRLIPGTELKGSANSASCRTSPATDVVNSN